MFEKLKKGAGNATSGHLGALVAQQISTASLSLSGGDDLADAGSLVFHSPQAWMM